MYSISICLPSLVIDCVPHDEGHLAECEGESYRHRAPDLEGDPGIRRKIAPNDLVEDRKKQEKEAPAQRQLVPALLVKLEGGAEDVAKKRLPEQQTAQQRCAKQR